jgi:fructose-bisphosphate aldolase class II
VPTAVLFNEARTVDQLRRGILSGCNAVMLDASHLPYSDNLTQTKRVTVMAHPLGAAVEAELGHLADATDASVQALGTDPDEAAAFVADTGIDALAVSIGNVHIMSSGVATIDLDLLERIHHAVQVPLVIHGGTGFPADAVRAVIARGVAKFNVGTRLKATYLQGIREAAQALSGNENIHTVMGSRDATDVLQCGKENLKQEIKRFIRLYGSEGKAA